ncbi:MAG: response regulator [Cytophagaceae bacterium]|nr:MAG: response regulator [Cytophagaceae bacterium]
MVTMSLDLYRMEEGTFRFVPETIDLVTIGRSVIAELGHHARSKNLRLEFDAATAGLKAVGNHLLTTLVVENLVRNALEAAPEYSVVTLGLYQGSRVGLLIHNEGEVSELIRDEFFEKYVTHGKQSGLGLGTYSARLIARAQGGDLTMTSSAENGTLLVLKLKRGAAEANAQTSLHSQLQTFGPSLPGALIELPLSTDLTELNPSIDILVVEDDDHNWMLLLSWLPKHVGARRAINGRQAVDALAIRRPDLVIMDLEMPIMSGFEALHRIREMQSSAGEEPSLIYAFTGYDDTDTTDKIQYAGFDGILTKPLQQGEFEDVLRVINSTSMAVTMQGELWIEKNFINAFPAFVDSRRALVDDIERAARVGDSGALRLAAHTLAGSPAIHGFNSGISICRQLIAMADKRSLADVDDLIVELRKLLSNPAVR